jgi:hypothetical protein
MRAMTPYFRCVLVAVTLAACQQDPYTFVVRPDGRVVDGLTTEGSPPSDMLTEKTPSDAKADACVPDPQGEICDGKDNNCDGLTDNVDASKMESDINNCGACNNACSFTNAFAKCENSKCVMSGCAPGYWDVNKDPKDGCEYQCLQTNGGVEICDNVDNDCDNVIDNGFDVQTDAKNCGTCGNACSSNYTTSTCVAGKCKVGTCDDGHKDINGDPMDGCEYQCPIWPPAATDPCDGVDNDCDSKIDEDFSPAACGSSIGECKAGTLACVGGLQFCQGEVGPKAEACDSKDNDCDGVTDNGFDKQNDPRYCGNCTMCSVPHAIAKCSAGVCGVAVCEVGWVDLDKDGKSCEYSCTVTGPEICDGLDNDCNGKIDTADSGMVPLGGNPCAFLGACAGATASCQGTSGWVCSYGADVELKKCTTDPDCGGSVSCTANVCPGVIAFNETRCDNKDNNCDGKTDEPFTNKGTACSEVGKKGICQGTGAYACNTAGTSTECKITAPGLTAKNEECNGLDDDCDGLTDETTDDAAGTGWHDTMAHIARVYNSTAYDFYIYTYEASRIDSTTSSAGAKDIRACSKVNVLPWSSVTYAQATAACVAAGKRLCTATEWLLACSGAPTDGTGCTTTTGDGCYYPYADAYDVTKCNGKSHFTPDAVARTGQVTTCKSPDNVYDMAGNLKEWTNDPRSDGTAPDPDGYVVRGGAYDTPYTGQRCDNTFAVMPPTYYFPNLGFRCCSNTAP